MFARQTALEVEVSLCSSLRFAHCAVDTQKPALCSLQMETYSEPICLPPLLLDLCISPRKVSTTTWDRRPQWNSSPKLEWLLSDKLGLTVAQSRLEVLADSTVPSTLLHCQGPADTGGLACGQRGQSTAALGYLSFHLLF